LQPFARRFFLARVTFTGDENAESTHGRTVYNTPERTPFCRQCRACMRVLVGAGFHRAYEIACPGMKWYDR
jgi:glycerol-3-phosphate cytidylyltransferase-like family protein